jgi:hypothetical protein
MSAGRFCDTGFGIVHGTGIARRVGAGLRVGKYEHLSKNVSLTFETNTGSLLPGADSSSTFHLDFLLGDRGYD